MLKYIGFALEYLIQVTVTLKFKKSLDYGRI